MPLASLEEDVQSVMLYSNFYSFKGETCDLVKSLSKVLPPVWSHHSCMLARLIIDPVKGEGDDII